jgi:hypothetical protein
VGTSCPRTSDSSSCTGCASDPSRNPRSSAGPPLARPGWPSPAERLPTPPLRNAERLVGCFQLVHSAPPRGPPVDQPNQPPMTQPLGSTPVPGASPLLRAGPPARPATVLNPSQLLLLGGSLSPPVRVAVSGAHLPTFCANAADQAHVASLPGTAWPVSGHPPDPSPRHRRPLGLLPPGLRTDTSAAVVFLVPT